MSAGVASWFCRAALFGDPSELIDPILNDTDEDAAVVKNFVPPFNPTVTRTGGTPTVPGAM